MDNHLHLILRNRPDLVATWADEEVARRWWQLCPHVQALRQWEQRHAGPPPADPATAPPLDRESEVEADLWLAPIALTGDSARPATVQSNPFPARRASDRGFLPLALRQSVRGGSGPAS